MTTLRDEPERFRVAFSFAGEQRPLVERLATAVENQLGRATVFYDDWFGHVLNGRNADLTLQRIYRDRCDMVVVCLSAEYGTKVWTSIEHEVVRHRYATEPLAVTLVRVGDGDVDGVPGNAIWVDARHDFDKAVDVILRRLTDAPLTPGRPAPASPAAPPSTTAPTAPPAPVANAASAPRTLGSAALATWRRKVDFLENALAMTADPAQRFAIGEQLAEARDHIARLEGGG